RSKKTSHPLKCRRLKKSISQTLSMIIEKKEKEKKVKDEKEKEKEKKAKEEKEREKNENKEKEKEKKEKQEKEKEKKKKSKVKVVSCDVKQQYPFEGFNIDGEGPTELMSSFSQWIKECLYKHHAKK
ncbi:hypothetical protein EJD97_003128, partial [Solanum chilense]